MKKYKDIGLGVILAGGVGLVLFGSIYAATVTTGDTVVVVTESDVYDRPKTTSDVVGSVAVGEVGVVLSTSVKPTGTYAKVDFSSVRGWVLDDVLEVQSDTPPSAPTALGATAQSASSIDLSWNDTSNNETGYEIERCDTSGCSNFALVVTVEANTNAYTDSSLVEETSYTYRVRAVNSSGSADYSNEASATTLELPAPPNGNPTDLTALSQGSSSIGLSWTDNATNESGYSIERCNGVGCSDFVAVTVTDPNITAFDDSGLASVTSYTYRVRALNEAGTSEYSNTATAVTDESTLPTNVTIGFLGCSMTRDKGTGLDLYTDVEGWTKVAPDGDNVLKSYSGGTITRWSEGNNVKWAAFEKGIEVWPDTDIILWEVCIRADEVTADVNDYIDDVTYIADRVATLTDAELYVKGMVSYDEGHFCSITGDHGVAFAEDVAELAAIHTHAVLATGLEFGPLGSHQVKDDACHANVSGMQEQACQIEAWLNGESPDGCQLE